jgi:hypothetical protein
MKHVRARVLDTFGTRSHLLQSFATQRAAFGPAKQQQSAFIVSILGPGGNVLVTVRVFHAFHA